MSKSLETSPPLEIKYGLPRAVKFCTKCVMSNQRPVSEVEFKHTIETKKKTMAFDADGVCDACRANEQKSRIDWEKREKEWRLSLDTNLGLKFDISKIHFSFRYLHLFIQV